MKMYKGIRASKTRLLEVYVDGIQLELEPSLKLRNHSPTGFEIGYRGSGPTQLALAILADCLQNDLLALRYYQNFRDDFIATYDFEGFILLESQIRNWIETQLKEIEE